MYMLSMKIFCLQSSYNIQYSYIHVYRHLQYMYMYNYILVFTIIHMYICYMIFIIIIFLWYGAVCCTRYCSHFVCCFINNHWHLVPLIYTIILFTSTPHPLLAHCYFHPSDMSLSKHCISLPPSLSLSLPPSLPLFLPPLSLPPSLPLLRDSHTVLLCLLLILLWCCSLLLWYDEIVNSSRNTSLTA